MITSKKIYEATGGISAMTILLKNSKDPLTKQIGLVEFFQELRDLFMQIGHTLDAHEKEIERLKSKCDK